MAWLSLKIIHRPKHAWQSVSVLDFFKAMFNGCHWQRQCAHFTVALLSLCRTFPSVSEPTRANSSKPARRTTEEKDLSGNYSVTFKQHTVNSRYIGMFLYKVHLSLENASWIASEIESHRFSVYAHINSHFWLNIHYEWGKNLKYLV